MKGHAVFRGQKKGFVVGGRVQTDECVRKEEVMGHRKTDFREKGLKKIPLSMKEAVEITGTGSEEGTELNKEEGKRSLIPAWFLFFWVF